MAKEKRVRRGFATIITDKVTKKYGEKVDEAALKNALVAIEKAIATLEEAKKACKKDSRKRARILAQFTKEELLEFASKL